MADDNNVQPLSTDDLRANASNWTLAGDVGLLAHLEEFSSKIFKKAESTENALNNLLDRVEEVSTSFNNVSNQFQSLQNSQFLENRVYDDETPTEEHNVTSVPQVEETQQQVLTKYKEAVANGLQFLDTHFEQVEVPQSSDSEDDPSDGGPALLLKPKVTYTKPLPLTIGSAEWWTDDTVGLGDFLENDESEPELSNSDSPPHTIEKRLRLISSSSSHSSDEVVEKTSKSKLPDTLSLNLNEPEPLFASVALPQENSTKGNDPLFGGSSNLFEDDQDALFAKPPTQISSHSNESATNAHSSKKRPETQKEILFGDDENDSIFSSESIPPNPINSKVSNEFTKELFAKLGSVAKNQIEPPNVEPSGVEPKKLPSRQPPSEKIVSVSHKNNLVTNDESSPAKISKTKEESSLFKDSKSKNQSGTGLFDNDSDFEDDFLFGGKAGPVRTGSLRPMAAPSKLFDDDDDEEDCSPSGAPIKNNQPGNKTSLSKKPKSTSVFSDNLFSDDLEDDLFSTTSDKLPPKVSFPRVMLTNSETNSPVFVEKSGLKSSTPAVGVSTPDDNLFGSISRLEKADSSTESQVSFAPNNLENLLEYRSNDDARIIESLQYDSRDLGFIETSDISEISNSENRNSPANWFQPQFSSTRAAGVVNETSGYRTESVGPSVDSAAVSGLAENLSGQRNIQKISSIAEETDSTNQDLVKSNSQKERLSDNNLAKQNNLDDLFHTEHQHENAAIYPIPNDPHELFKPGASSSQSLKQNVTIPQVSKTNLKGAKPTNTLSLFDDEDDDLFSAKAIAKPKVVSENPLVGLSQTKDNSTAASVKPVSLFSDDIEDNILFSDRPNKPQDNVSISSGRSSLFEEPTVGKSSLPSIFGEKAIDKSSIIKTSLFEDVDDDIDLFSNKKKEIPKIDKDDKKSKPEMNSTDISDLSISKIKQETSKDKEHHKSTNNDLIDSTNLFLNKKPTPPSSLNIQKVSISNHEAGGVNVNVAVTKKIGKLNIPSNLNINTSALLPGAKLSKPTVKLADTDIENVCSNEDSIDAPVKNLGNKPNSNESQISVSDHILPSTLKDRVRISVKRRPQSRRARQDALRNSGIDFSPTDETTSVSSSTASITTPSQNIISPSTDEEDFHVPDLDLVNDKEDKYIFNDVSSKKEVKTIIDESLLFNSAPVISPSADKSGKKTIADSSSSSGGKSSVNLFQSNNLDSDDDDLFSSVKSLSTSIPRNNQPNALSDKPKKTFAKNTMSLFGDIEDDGIFSGKATSANTIKPSTALSTLPKSTVENVSPNFLDPLGLLKTSKD